MRIQHNIMAMNAYRNFGNNTSALSKNLEKLSSGYKINRAGDDAAGLAISEKMRAQITGLKAATKNVKDGISLVKTAEGAMQEIHDMLNRMDYLATQSANGTYDNEVDRANLQKEVESLKSEIDRISKSANFNGQKLLDGSLAGGSGVSGAAPSISGLDTDTVAATKGKFVTAAMAAPGAGTLKNGDTLSMTVNYTDNAGNKKSSVISVTYSEENGAGKFVVGDKEFTLAKAGEATNVEVSNAFAAAIKESGLGDVFKVSANTGALTFDAREGGVNPKVDSITVNYTATGADKTGKETALNIANTTMGVDAYEKFNFAGFEPGEVFTINGQKFSFAKTEADAAKLGSDVHSIILADGQAVADGDVEEMVKLIKSKTGLTGIEVDNNTNTQINFKAGASGVKGSGGMKLQIGDTSADYEQLTVTIGNMSSASLGIGGLDIGTPDGAHSAIDQIKAAINSVSATRGDLGAIQNRLEHTQNNLSVMTENIQDAESTIRDTDVAEEMMAYTKNNILIQSAQAMLAQANQVPQGVLQLMQ